MDTLTELLFSDDKEDEEGVGYLPVEVDMKDIEKVHLIYISPLINVYEKLKKTYGKYVKLFNEQALKDVIKSNGNGLTLEALPLIIQHN